MYRLLFLSVAFAMLAILPALGHADCQCMCVNGSVQAMCSSAIDLKPICAPRICPITNPSVTPIMPPRVPPIGTTSCHQAQVYNEYTQQYEWHEVCQ
jgi:hypothetical protein